MIEAPRPELYDLARDPGEQRNIFDQKPAVSAAMLERLRIVGGPVSEPPGGADPKDHIQTFNRMTNLQWERADRFRGVPSGCAETPVH